MLIKSNRLICLLLTFLPSIFSYSQIVQIKGTVVDKNTQKPLQGVSIHVSKYKGSVTNNKGFFSIGVDTTTNTYQLSFSFIGYKKATISCLPNISNMIELVPTSSNLKEVIVSTRAKTLIERAIDKIPDNYPSKPFIINGIFRVYNIVNDSDYYYKADGVVKAFSPAYNEDNGKQQVKLIQNKFVLRENKLSKFYNTPTEKHTWVGQFYNIDDYVFNRPNYINKKHLKNYIYTEREKIIFEGRKVYVVDFESKTKKQVEGTIYLDTATLAFVKFDVTRYNVNGIFFVPIAIGTYSTTYQLISGKWYVKESQGESKYNTKHDAHYFRNFVTTSVDTNDVKSFDYQDVLQLGDENIKTLKEGNKDDWATYDSLFKKEEVAGNIPLMKVPNIDTTKTLKNKNVISALYKYLRSNNLRILYSLGKQPIDTKNSNYGSLAEYGLGLSIGFRLYRGLFFERGSKTFYGLGGISAFTNHYQLDYEFKVNKLHRPMYIMPYAGYAYTQIAKNKQNIDQSFKSWVFGVNLSIEMTRRRSFFIAPTYHYNYYQGGTYTGIEPTNFAFSIGYIFKR
ncbi:MAG: carboxypeptidase-like regulatory domain-containing protein [Flavobacterium sp.]|nr:carboxypeptidase-like regulatory domain-containing protein [Flavobacterium sp.]